jgi:hypothetical protein
MEFKVSGWYRLLEGICELAFLAALIYGTWQIHGQPITVPMFLGVLPIPVLFFLTSLFFRSLSSGVRPGQTPLIASMLTMFRLVDITGLHLVVLIILVAFALVAAVTHADSLAQLVKYLIGFFAGLQVEKKRERAAAQA